MNVKEMGYKSPASGNLAKQRRLLPATMAAEGAGEDGSGYPVDNDSAGNDGNGGQQLRLGWRV